MSCPLVVQGDDKPCVSYIIGGFCQLSDHFRCINYLEQHEPRLSYSEVVNFTSCPYKFHLSFNRGLKLRDPGWPRLLGGLVSNCLDILHSKEGGEVSYAKLTTPYLDSEGQPPYQLVALGAVMQAYHALDKDSPKGSTQEHFDWYEPGYPNLHGYADLIQYEDEEGPRIGYEFKYSGRPDSWSKWVIEDQFTTYFLGWPSLQRMTLRVIKQPQLRLGRKETLREYKDRVYADAFSHPREYFQDHNYFRAEFSYERYKERLKIISQQIVSFAKLGPSAFYQTSSRTACFSPYACDFLSCCESGVISDTLYSTRKNPDVKTEVEDAT